jgi:hypothetical protein
MSHMWIGVSYFNNEEDFQRLVDEREPQQMRGGPRWRLCAGRFDAYPL